MENKKKVQLIILTVFLIVAIIIGVYFRSWNTFFSSLFIELWFIIPIKFLKKRKELNEYNSPHNTSFFVLAPMIIGLFYSFWGYFTTFLGENLLVDLDTVLTFNLWVFFLAFPYLLYGLNSLYSCYTKKKFNLVYLYKAKAIDARKFAFLWNFIILMTIILFWIFSYYFINFRFLPVNPMHSYLDLILLITGITIAVFLLYPGIFSKGSSIPLMSTMEITRRMEEINRITLPPVSTRTSNPQSRTRPRAAPSRQKQQKKVSTTARRKPKTKQSVNKKLLSTAVFKKYKPKAGIITIEDFKCIFCFKLPKLPDDRNKGIILCPNCRYPAHAGEFKDWLRSSKLCSRCDTPIPASFIHHPKVISTENYLKVIEKFRSKNN